MRKAWHAIGVTLLAVSLADTAYAQTQFGKIVSFGDSSSDGGTYTNFFKSLNLPGANQVTRFKFTTNPGNVRVENIANRFGIPLTPNALDGGLNYAEGGARVTLPNPSAQGLSQNSVSVQIDRFLASGGSFRKNDIVTMLIGPNDLFQGGPTAAAPAATAVIAQLGRLQNAGAKEHHPAQSAGHRLHSAVWFRNGSCIDRRNATFGYFQLCSQARSARIHWQRPLH